MKTTCYAYYIFATAILKCFASLVVYRHNIHIYEMEYSDANGEEEKHWLACEKDCETMFSENGVTYRCSNPDKTNCHVSLLKINETNVTTKANVLVEIIVTLQPGCGEIRHIFVCNIKAIGERYWADRTKEMSRRFVLTSHGILTITHTVMRQMIGQLFKVKFGCNRCIVINVRGNIPYNFDADQFRRMHENIQPNLNVESAAIINEKYVNVKTTTITTKGIVSMKTTYMPKKGIEKRNFIIIISLAVAVVILSFTVVIGLIVYCRRNFSQQTTVETVIEKRDIAAATLNIEGLEGEYLRPSDLGITNTQLDKLEILDQTLSQDIHKTIIHHSVSPLAHVTRDYKHHPIPCLPTEEQRVQGSDIIITDNSRTPPIYESAGNKCYTELTSIDTRTYSQLTSEDHVARVAPRSVSDSSSRSRKVKPPVAPKYVSWNATTKQVTRVEVSQSSQTTSLKDESRIKAHPDHVGPHSDIHNKQVGHSATYFDVDDNKANESPHKTRIIKSTKCHLHENIYDTPEINDYIRDK